MKVRPPAVAGSFYPAEPGALRAVVDEYLAAAAPHAGETPPSAVVAPHAGYLYSGPVAGSAFAALAGAADRFARVAVLGPSHYVPFAGLALPTVEAFRTPLGTLALDADAASTLADLPQVLRHDAPHAREHSLEVELPFLQRLLGDFRLVALAAGDAEPGEVAAVLERLDDGRTLFVVSTDLSHYHAYDTATRLDRRTSAAIEALDVDGIGEADACGRVPLRGLLAWARERALGCRCLDLRNSGDTAGPADRVVGYGAYVLG